VGEARKVILDADELQRLVDVCAADLRDLILMGAWTGCRLSELTSRLVRDFDDRNAVLHVPSGKTGPRDVHLPPDAVALLRRLTSGKGPGDLLLTTAKGRPWEKSYVRIRFLAAANQAGLEDGAVFYSLRHSFISRALVAGVPTRAVAEHCGTSVAMVERHYAKFLIDMKATYAAAAAPPLRVERGDKVVVLRRGNE
jgi:integrase